MRLNITMPDNLIKELDAHCELIKDDRSGVIAEAVRSLLYFRKGVTEKNLEKIIPEDISGATDIMKGKVSPKKLTPPTTGWCNLQLAHGWVSGKKYEVRLITWEDENGVEVEKEKWGCEDCIKHLAELGKGRLIYL